jgi:LmbE family N-acetylglucosaminyl deacetylase
MAFHGIVACYASDAEWFGGVVCTDGAGSLRPDGSRGVGEFCQTRRSEQQDAARIGRYGVMVQLGYSSGEARQPGSKPLRDDLAALLCATNPRVVYTHNPADAHATHVGVAVAAIEAMRSLPADARPAQVYGCEVWRSLDWLDEDFRIALDVGGHDELAAELVGVFKSQIAGGKRYDLAVIGRRQANATFSEPHAADRTSGVTFAMNLAPLVADESLDITAYVDGLIDRFREHVRNQLHARLGK